MKKSLLLSVLLLTTVTSCSEAADKKTTEEETTSKASDENCQAPAWAVAMGHKERWKLHNGCSEPTDKVKKELPE